jgi:hypothetical protein
MTSKQNIAWAAALVPYDEITCDVLRPTVFMDDDVGEDEQKRFYKSLLKIRWLAPNVRYAVMMELGLSLREQRRQYEKGRTAALHYSVKEAKERMRKNGERPRGGIHEAAVAEIAQRQGMTAAALKKHFQRHKY